MSNLEVEQQDHVSKPVLGNFLTAADRCDACGAQAYVRVELVTGELLFCGHHAKENEAKLRPIASKWHDESDKLLTK
jgi:uncharacterized protein involved in propanediol utilization